MSELREQRDRALKELREQIAHWQQFRAERREMSWTPTERDPQELIQDYRRERTELMRQLTEARDIENYMRKTIMSSNDLVKRLRREIQRLREPEPVEVHEPMTREINAVREMMTAEESDRVSERYRIVAQMQGHWLTFAQPRKELWAGMHDPFEKAEK